MRTSGLINNGENRINLSPILALNKKLDEGPKFLPKKSLTPDRQKTNEDYGGYGQQSRTKFQRNFNTQASISDSKGSNNYNSTTNLRGSNCFKALIENRCKSPNRFQGSSGGKAMNRVEGTPKLKQSLSSNQLFTNLGLDSKGKLA